MSVCVNEKTWPTCSEPLTVGGGVSIEYTSARGRVRSKRYTPVSSQRAIHFASSPSSAGLSGTRTGWFILLVGLDSLNLFPHEAFRGVEDGVPRLVGQPGDDAGGHRLDQFLRNDWGGRDGGGRGGRWRGRRRRWRQADLLLGGQQRGEGVHQRRRDDAWGWSRGRCRRGRGDSGRCRLRRGRRGRCLLRRHLRRGLLGLWRRRGLPRWKRE